MISIDNVVAVVNGLHYGDGSYAFALNSKGEAIVHPNSALMSTLEKPAPSFLNLPDRSLAAIAQYMVNRERGIQLIPIEGTQQYVAYIPLKEANWSVALVIPRQNIEAQLRPLDLIAIVMVGLAISNKLVNLMGSQIGVQSQVGVGSTFSFEVDLLLADGWIQDAITTNGKKIVGYQGERRTILVVDDKWENRSVLVNLLEPLGFKVVEAENGQEGLKGAIDSNPNLIITDIVMPVMNGYEMLQQLRQRETLKAIRVVVSSASVSQSDRLHSLKAGADDFLAKPVQADELFRLLEKHLAIAWEL